MNFHKRVFKAVSKIPRGNVTSYGFIATYIDKPRSARAVGWALRTLPYETNVPWWRVINSHGYISIKNPSFSKELQKYLLEKEGIPVSNKFMVDLRKYMWRPNEKSNSLQKT